MFNREFGTCLPAVALAKVGDLRRETRTKSQEPRAKSN